MKDVVLYNKIKGIIQAEMRDIIRDEVRKILDEHKLFNKCCNIDNKLSSMRYEIPFFYPEAVSRQSIVPII